MSGTVWLAGRWRELHNDLWEVVGIFTSRELADAACTTVDHWITELPLDTPAPEETASFPNPTYWPRRGQEAA